MPRFLLFLLAFAFLILPQRARSQYYPPWVYGPPTPRHPNQPFDPVDLAPFSVAVSLALGLQNDAKTGTSRVSIGGAGIYAELNRNHLHPGIDLRGITASNGNVGGMLVGPRFSCSAGVLHPYVEGLAGPNHALVLGTDHQGVIYEFTVGVEIAYSQNVRWRVLEYTHGVFTGLPDSHPDAYTTALVLHFP